MQQPGAPGIVAMRLLLVHQSFSSPNEPGGTRHFEFARRLVEDGHQVTVVGGALSYLTGERIGAGGGWVTEQTVEGVRILRAYTYPSLHRSFSWRVFAFFTFMLASFVTALKAGPADLVMGTSPPIFPAVSAWVVSRLRRRPYLLEVRDLWPEFAIDLGVLRHPVLIALSRWLERFLYSHAVHLLVNSPAYRDYLIGKGVPPDRITLIANGVDPAMFDPDATGGPIREAWAPNGEVVVTYAGALGMANDIPTILDAADRLRHHPHIRFFLVGDGKERPNLERMARERQLANVTFAGPRRKSEMADILAASDICLATLQNIPMFRTTYPNKVFDYMAAGRPTVLAIDGVIREVVEASGGGVFVPPGDSAALAEAVLSLAQDPQRRRQMGAAARAYVSEHFNRHRQAEEFAALVLRLAGNRQAAPAPR